MSAFAISAGATPKVTMSARLSSAPPKLVVVRVMRATRPSRPSHAIPARTSQPASASRPPARTPSPAAFAAAASATYASASSPHTRLPSVTAVGSVPSRNGCRRRRGKSSPATRRDGGTPARTGPEGPSSVRGAAGRTGVMRPAPRIVLACVREDLAEDGQAPLHLVADRDVPAHLGVGPQPHLGARAELDHAVAFAGSEPRAGLHGADDAARNRAGHLPHDHAHRRRRGPRAEPRPPRSRCARGGRTPCASPRGGSRPARPRRPSASG